MQDRWETTIHSIEGFAPQLLAAVALLVGGLLLAWALSALTRSLLGRTTLDDRLAARLASDEGGKPPRIEAMVSRLVFWIVVAFTLVGFLQILDLAIVAGPLGGFLGEIFAFLPNLLSAALLLFVGWIVARLVRFGVRSAASAAQVDERVGENLGSDAPSLSRSVANAAYWLVLLLFLPGVLDALQIHSITEPVNDMLHRVLVAIPHLFAAALLLGIAYLVSRVVAGVVSSLLAGLGFDEMVARLSAKSPATPTVSSTSTVAGRRPSELVGYLVMVAILLFASIEAMEILGFDRLANLLVAFTVLAGQVLLALAIFAVGLYLAELAARSIRASQLQDADLLARVARGALIFLAAAMALRESGFANDLVLTVFTLLVGAAAVAAAIAFGIGGRDVAKRHLERWSESAEQRRLASGAPPPQGAPPPPR